MDKNGIAFTKPLSSGRGFTLLELLVAITIVSMITLIVSFALKFCIQSWDRVQNEGDTFQVLTAVPFILRGQLRSMADKKEFGDGKMYELGFTGNESGFSFFTTDAPSSLDSGGLYRTAYRFDREEKELLLFQSTVTTPEDLEAQWNPVSDKWNQKEKPKGIIDEVEDFSVGYAKSGDVNLEDTGIWTNDWENKSGKKPGGMKFVISLKGGQEKNKVQRWFFRTGMNQ